MVRLGKIGRSVAPFTVAFAFLIAQGCKKAAPPEEKTPPATVKWQSASENALEEWTELVGTTMPLPDRIARVTAAVEGRVATVLTGANGKPVAEGQHVAKGSVLVQLDDAIVKANLAKLKAMSDVLEEEFKQAQNAVELASIDVQKLKTLLAQEKQRPQGAGTIPLVSPVEREKADLALKDAQYKLQAAKGKKIAGQKEITALEEQLRFYTLRAPIAGRVGRIQVLPGQTLSVGTQVAEVVDLDNQIDVLSFVPPRVLPKLKIGQQARSGPLEKEASAAPEAEGEIIYIADQGEPETGNFAVKVRFNNKDARLRSNSVLRLRVLTHPTKPCLALPQSAVSEDEEIPTVVIVEDIKTQKNQEGKEEIIGVARRVQAVLGLRDRMLHQVEIVSLADPDKESKKKWSGDVKDQQFVVENGQGLQTGDRVKLEADEE